MVSYRFSTCHALILSVFCYCIQSVQINCVSEESCIEPRWGGVKTSISCSNPSHTLVSCGHRTLDNGEDNYRGSWISENVCWAENGIAIGMCAIARCCDLSAYSVSCSDVVSAPAEGDAIETSATCGASDILMGCTVQCPGGSTGGVYPKTVGSRLDTCTARSHAGTGATLAHARCCRLGSAEHSFVCERVATNVGTTFNTMPCPEADQFMTSCSALTQLKDVNGWEVDTSDLCKTRGYRKDYEANAICCRVEGPTADPTAFTANPSAGPTAVTVEPTANPSASPSKNPTPAPSQHPSVSPSSNPTLAPSQHPTLSPSVDPTQSTSAPSLRPSVSPTLYPIALTDVNDIDAQTTNYEISIEIIACEDDDDTTCSLNPDDISALEEGVASATKEILVASGVVRIVGSEIVHNEVVVRLSITQDSDANALESDAIEHHIAKEISDMEQFGEVNVEQTDTEEVSEDEDTFLLQPLLYNPLVMGSLFGFAVFVLICCLSVGIFCVCRKKKAAASNAIHKMAEDQAGSTEAMDANQNPKETAGHKPNVMDEAGIISFQDKLMEELQVRHVAPVVAVGEGDTSDEDGETDEDLYTDTINKGENGATPMAPPPAPNVVYNAPPVPNIMHMVIDHAIHNEEVGVTDEGNEDDVDIVKEYRDKYGTEPQNVNQLMKFSKTDKRYKALSYKEAKSILGEATKGNGINRGSYSTPRATKL